MFRNLRKKIKKQFELEKKVKTKTFSSCPNFIFGLYNLISPNLQIILKKKLHTWVDLKEAPYPENSKIFGHKSKKWDPHRNSKNTICPLGVKMETS